MSHRSTAVAIHSLFSASLFVLGACQTDQSKVPAPPPASAYESQGAEKQRAEISSEFTAAAVVTAIAKEERVVTLRRDDGALFEVQAGEGVRNFDQIAVGDELRVRYKAMLSAEKLSAGDASRPAQGGAIAAARAKPGAKPGAGLGLGVTVRVKIESLDPGHAIVVFSLPSGELIAHRIQTPQGRDFIKGLSVGDNVQLVYAEALALSVEKL